MALAIASALLLGAPVATLAQDQEEVADLMLEEVLVTGTRRAGLSPIHSLSPVDVVSGEEIAYQGSSDMTESLVKLQPALNTQRYPIADGTAFVRPVVLRNLAPDQTLVLLNGTRRHRSALVNLQVAPLGTTNQGSQAVDFSAIPTSAIKRVEILRDGASAQYGSDAIAGVINVILKDDREGASFNAQYGEYSGGEGERVIFNAGAGFGLGSEGFLYLAAEYNTSDITSAGQARPDAATVADIVGAENVPYNGLGQRWGDPDVEAVKFSANLGIPFGDGLEFFGNATYMDNETLGGFFYRVPVLDPQYMINGRNTLIKDTDGDFLPDPASQALVDSIVGASLDPSNYLTADPNSPSGWVLLNPVHTQFPGGYSPLFGATITDYEVVGGLKGWINDSLSWNTRLRTSENEIEYNLEGSINPSLGLLSPNQFNPGTLVQEESSVNIDFVKIFENSPLNMAFGLEWRNEIYRIRQGDPASTVRGPTFTVFGEGSDGFQGFFPEMAGEWEKDSYAAYVDVETDLTDTISGAVAVRYEDHDDFGSTTDFKLSGRWQVTDSVALRATYNTGFRVPTPGQVNTLNVTTSADANGNLVPSGFYPVDHPIALVLGAVPQTTEESDSFSVGLVWEASDRFNVMLDFYSIDIEDRIGSIDKSVDQAAVDALNAQGYPNADLLLGSLASYFSNAFDSEVTGVDLTIESYWDLWGGDLTASYRHNHNEQDVTNVKPGTINASRIYDLENQVPEDRGVLNFDWQGDTFGGLLRFNYWGGWSTTPGLFSAGDASDAADYGSEILVDLEARMRFGDHFTLAVGGDNIFDTFPDKEQDGTFQFLGVIHSITSPFGFNGAFWYARGTFTF